MRLAVLAVPAALLLSVALAGRRAHAEDAKATEAPPTVVVEKGPFTVVIESAGVFDAVGAVEVAVEPEAYGGEWKVVESFAGPAPVEAGRVLVRFDTDKIDEQLALAEKDLEIATRALAQRREDARRAEEAAAVAMTQAELEKSAADERLAHFLETDRDLRVKESEERLRGTRDNVQDQEEELAQLRKMYRGDDVVEETEEIVMKRAERALARTKLWLGFQETRHRVLVDLELPRERRSIELDVRRTSLALDALRAKQGTALEQARLDLAKAELTHERQKVGFDRLRGDRDRFVVKAPVAGIAVPGGLVRGKWGAVDDAARALASGKTVGARATLFTIVKPGAVAFRTPVPEASVLSVAPGQPVELTSTALGATALAGKVERVAPAPSEGGYEVVVSLEKGDERLFPGHTGKAKIRTAEKPDVVTVPSPSVVADGEKRLVHVVSEDLRALPREVKVGATSGGRTEIVEGLAGGERVLVTPPKP
jgi:RND family efflux transporter MFP subunit